MLAYVFWHAPRGDEDTQAYELALAAFHRRLGDSAVSGLVASAAFRVRGAAWLGAAVAYEDWYLVEDFTALGTLNDAAVAAPSLAAHDDVARLAGSGVGGLYALRAGEARLASEPAAWFARPASVAPSAIATLAGAGDVLWQRQLTLGPTPELCLTGRGPLPAGAQVVIREAQVAPPAGGAGRT